MSTRQQQFRDRLRAAVETNTDSLPPKARTEFAELLIEADKLFLDAKESKPQSPSLGTQLASDVKREASRAFLRKAIDTIGEYLAERRQGSSTDIEAPTGESQPWSGDTPPWET